MQRKASVLHVIPSENLYTCTTALWYEPCSITPGDEEKKGKGHWRKGEKGKNNMKKGKSEKSDIHSSNGFLKQSSYEQADNLDSKMSVWTDTGPPASSEFLNPITEQQITQTKRAKLKTLSALNDHVCLFFDDLSGKKESIIYYL